MSTALAKLEKIRTAIEQANTVDEIVAIRDQATAVVTYAKAARLSVDIVNAAVEAKLRTEMKCGRLLAAMEKHNGDPLSRDVTRLSELGIERMQSHRWQKLAQIPDDEFASFVADRTKSGDELTTAAMLRHWATCNAPSNGHAKATRGELTEMLGKLHGAIKRLYVDWPEKKRAALADKLRAYADEIDTTGGLAL